MASVMIAQSCVRVGSAASWSRTYLRRNNNYTQRVNARARPSSVFELRNDFRFRAPLMCTMHTQTTVICEFLLLNNFHSTQNDENLLHKSYLPIVLYVVNIWRTREMDKNF